MGKLLDLRIPLDEMTDEELRDHIRFVRQDRRTFKLTAKTPRTKRAKKANGLMKIMKNMTPAEKLALLESLEGGKK